MLKESYYTSTSGTGTLFGADAWYAMSFTATSDYLLGSVKHRVWREGAVDPGVVTISIRTADATTQLPTGDDLLSTTVAGTTFPTQSPIATLTDALLITFATSIAISNGQTYAVIYRCVEANKMKFRRNDYNYGHAYDGGRNGTSSDAGENWSGISGTSDNQFAVYSVTTALAASGTINGKSNGTGVVAGGTAIPPATEVARLIPFIYSSEIAYEVELGNQYMRFFYDGAVLLDDDYNEVWIETPYVTADLPQLQYKQVGDVMWITHPSYAQRKLTRTSATSFSLDIIPYTNGPFRLRNDLIDPLRPSTITMASNVTGETLATGEYNLTSYGGQNKITNNWWDGNAQNGVDNNQGDYCGGGRKSDGRIVYMTYTAILDETEAALTDITIAYICMSHDQGADLDAHVKTQRGLRVCDSDGTWTTVVDLDSPGSDFPATTYHDKPSSLVGLQSEITISGTWTNVKKIEIFLYAKASEHSTACAIFNIEAGTATSVTGLLTVSDSYFDEDMLGTLFKLTQKKVTTKVSLVGPCAIGGVSAALDTKGGFRVVTYGTWTGTFEVQINDSNSGWDTYRTFTSKNNFNAAETFPAEDRDDIQYRLYATTVITKGFSADLTLLDVMQDGIVKMSTLYHDLTVDTAPTAAAFEVGATLTGATSGVTCDVVKKVSDTYYIVTEPSGTFTDGEVISDGTNSVDCATGYPVVAFSETVTGITIVRPLASTDATKRWAEGAWSDYRGFPAATAFYEDRCCFAGMAPIPSLVPDIDSRLLTVWLGHSGDYENFEAGVKAADSFELVVPTANDIMWFEALEALVLGTSGDEWRIGSNRMEQPLTPTNYTVRQQSTYGGRNIQAIRANDKILFVDFVGRKIQELAYNGDKYVALDLTSLAEHITLSGIVWTAYQKNPDSILWCGLDNGSLIGMVYNREQNVVAWFPCPIDGDVYSGCVTPGANEDNVTLAVKRTINDADVVCIEKFSSRIFTDIEDCFFVDCGITYEGAATSTITGLGHLEGKTVKVLGNGVVFDDAVVSSAQITTKLATVTTTVTKAQVGLAYTSKLQPMRIVVGTSRGSSQGLVARVPKMSISFLNSMDAQYGASDTNLKDINWDDPQLENSEDSIAGLFTGEATVSVDGGFSVQNPIIVSTDAPLPCVIRSLMPRLEVSGG